MEKHLESTANKLIETAKDRYKSLKVERDNKTKQKTKGGGPSTPAAEWAGKAKRLAAYARHLRLPLPFVPARCRCRTLLAITALHVRDLVSCEHGAAHLNGRQHAFVVTQGPWLLCTHWSGTSMSAACPEMTGGLKS